MPPLFSVLAFGTDSANATSDPHPLLDSPSRSMLFILEPNARCALLFLSTDTITRRCVPCISLSSNGSGRAVSSGVKLRLCGSSRRAKLEPYVCDRGGPRRGVLEPRPFLQGNTLARNEYIIGRLTQSIVSGGSKTARKVEGTLWNEKSLW